MSQREDIEAALRKAGLRVKAVTPNEKVERVSTGFLSMDRALGGGWAMGMINGISGLDGYGKTTMALQAIRSFLETDPRPAIYFDAESKLDPTWALRNGLDIDRLAIFRGYDENMNRFGQETMLKMITMAVSQDLCGLIVIDSLAAMAPQQVGIGDKGDPEYGKVVMGVRARNFGDFFAVIPSQLFARKITLLIINQLRDSLNPYGESFVEPGGRAKNYGYSINVRLSRPAYIIDTETKESIGITFNGKVRKNSTAPDGQEFSAHLGFHPSGQVFPDIIPSLCELGKELGIFTNANGEKLTTGTWHWHGEPLMIDGDKVNSIAAARKFLVLSPTVRKEVEQEIRELI